MASARRQMLDKFSEIGGKLPPFLVKRIGASLKGSGLTLREQELAGFSVAFLAAGALVGVALGGMAGLILLASLGAAAPVLACKAVGGVRAGKVARQLEQVAESFAMEVTAGRPFFDVISQAAQKMPDPLSEELRIVLAEYNSGLPFEEAWERLALRARTSEIYQIVTVFRDHLQKGKDPLEAFRILNLKQPFDIPPIEPELVPASFEDAVHRLHTAVLNSMETRQLTSNRPAGGLKSFFAERAQLLVGNLTLAEPARSRREQLVGALCDEVEGRGPLEALMRLPTVAAIYVMSPNDIFAAQLPAEMTATTTPPGGAETPEGYQRAKLKFRSPQHFIRVIERVIAPLGGRLDKQNTTVEGVLPDGWECAAQMRPDGTPALALGRAQG